MRTISPDATPEGADWLKTHTEYALGDPPMIGWWETIIADKSFEWQPSASAPTFMRWWGGPVSGWSIAVTPYYQGLELHRIAEMPWRPSSNDSVIWWRGLRLPAKKYRYPLGVQCIDAAAVRAYNKDLVAFREQADRLTEALSKAGEIKFGPQKPRVRVEAEQLELPLPRQRVVIRGEMPRYGVPGATPTYGTPATKQRVKVLA